MIRFIKKCFLGPRFVNYFTSLKCQLFFLIDNKTKINLSRRPYEKAYLLQNL